MLSDAAGVEKARVKASVIVLREAFIEERFGVSATQRLRSLASSALRAVLHKEVDGWVPFELFIEVMELMESTFGAGDGKLVFDVGHFAASFDQSVWKRMLLRRIGPATLVSLSRAAWSNHYDGGRLISRPLGVNAMTVSIVDFPQPHRYHCLAIAGWMLGSLEMGPRKHPEVVELSCRCKGAPTCDFRLSWQD